MKLRDLVLVVLEALLLFELDSTKVRCSLLGEADWNLQLLVLFSFSWVLHFP